jgi:hypothetical protein
MNKHQGPQTLSQDCQGDNLLNQDSDFHVAAEMTVEKAGVQATIKALGAFIQNILAFLTPAQRQALDSGSSAALAALLEEERQDRLPEVLRHRPRLYYYERWMSSRIR